MIVLPSIDIEGGRAVKRERGERGTGLTDLGDPLELAQHWQRSGAKGLHVADLDGAEGSGRNREVILRLIRASKTPVQVGGGVREIADLEELLHAGAWRALLSTRGWSDPEWLKGVSARFGPRVGLSFDVRAGRLLLRGWKEAGPTVEEGLRIAGEAGIGFLLFTDVAREGRSGGIDRTTVRELRDRYDGDLYVAGGVASVEEVRALASAGVDGVIVGRALYDGKVPLSALREEFS
ncbi:MAG: 1-(5-phosphoribosyl)-5-[(5-phosphoribosylamino)methylideneamino] imidazole-4-carboxamide isomerase [Euryarchaeota archaeon]|nr:1-(5-phosphoribosyl)-5-[(5-phosphoribosylamino)methylideneamino] imidazole-4-carboxamide isomerase [Euryarchaeota archaeon]MDE1836751.1 1-(5-phosphoribosyl)-5-[(5-phosphoribosylamino)methylideneamino] imidazole-4-carboxamide isomerase [Euryarchaeota archaeon]MDE1879769.1 1-(5-phosphoribosyl)-5-[(5-phosphoribosylamino)methylideneamino] imidazole-4-carboxamide isomerase [Euryarchaeota archaeon]MDE2044735.1 1-(5-phosphoribosyl)-5-[(5-phosphoribosylamino)methylideneamino] imidazole-4-carboxamide 